MSRVDITSIDHQKFIFMIFETVESPPTPTKQSRHLDVRKKKVPSKYIYKVTIIGVIRRRFKKEIKVNLKSLTGVI